MTKDGFKWNCPSLGISKTLDRGIINLLSFSGVVATKVKKKEFNSNFFLGSSDYFGPGNLPVKTGASHSHCSILGGTLLIWITQP